MNAEVNTPDGTQKKLLLRCSVMVSPSDGRAAQICHTDKTYHNVDGSFVVVLCLFLRVLDLFVVVCVPLWPFCFCVVLCLFIVVLHFL